MPRLVIKQGPGIGRDHALGPGECVVGRDASTQFVLEDTLVSRRHFKVVPEAGAWYVEDLGSTNGTIVNGQRAQRKRLTDGDRIRVGTTRLTFVQKDLLGAVGGAAAQTESERPKPAASKAPPAPSRRKRHLR